MQSKYWPYDEMAFIWKKEQNTLTLACPWLSARLKFENEEVGFLIEKALGTITQTEIHQDGVFAVSEMMKLLKEFPIYYCLPRNQMPSDESLSGEDIDFSSTWDHETLLKLSQVGKTEFYDPLTLLTGARRFHLMHSFEKKRVEKSYEKASGLLEQESTKKLIQFVDEAQKNPLGFAMIVDIFHQKDQLALALKKDALQSADELPEENPGHKLLLPMPAVGKDYALSAARWAEKALHLIDEVDQELCQKTLH